MIWPQTQNALLDPRLDNRPRLPVVLIASVFHYDFPGRALLCRTMIRIPASTVRQARFNIVKYRVHGSRGQTRKQIDRNPNLDRLDLISSRINLVGVAQGYPDELEPPRRSRRYHKIRFAAIKPNQHSPFPVGEIEKLRFIPTHRRQRVDDSPRVL